MLNQNNKLFDFVGSNVDGVEFFMANMSFDSDCFSLREELLIKINGIG